MGPPAASSSRVPHTLSTHGWTGARQLAPVRVTVDSSLEVLDRDLVVRMVGEQVHADREQVRAPSFGIKPRAARRITALLLFDVGSIVFI